ncbi:MAG: ribonuclease P protein component [Albidovulum sp.]|uniref:ribonuclease P protein component n=1 Tax=Albidovulum sp. TaxID=1872424 RepID=UPI003C94088D
MTPPEAPVQGQLGRGADQPPAVSVCLKVLSKRADFLKAAQAKRRGSPGFLLQARERREGEPDPDLIRIGYTCSKKVGNAVARNRAKRRLREIARIVLTAKGRPGWDYVLVGRPEVTATRDFAEMQRDLNRALDHVHGTVK